MTRTTAQLSSSGKGDSGHDRSKAPRTRPIPAELWWRYKQNVRQEETASNKIQIFLHLEEKNKCSRGEDELASSFVGKTENESTRVSNLVFQM